MKIYLQIDQLYMAVCFWYLVKRYLSSLHYVLFIQSSVHYRVTFYKVPEQHSHVYPWSGCNTRFLMMSSGYNSETLSFPATAAISYGLSFLGCLPDMTQELFRAQL